MILLDGAVKLEPRAGYLFVWHGRSAKSTRELDLVLRGMDALLDRHRLDRLLIDSRRADLTPPEVQQGLWAWLQRRELVRVASLIESRLLAVSVRMGGVSNAVKIRAFDDLEAAEAWLLS